MFALWFWLLAISASTIHFLARPHVRELVVCAGARFGFWIPSSAILLPPRNGQEATPIVVAAPGLMLVWVNVHGGFLLEFMLLGIFWLGALWTLVRATGEYRSRSRFAKSRRESAFESLTWVGHCRQLWRALMNPYGWKLHEHIYHYLTNRFLMDHIEEFQSPNFHGLAQRCFLLVVAVVDSGANCARSTVVR